MNKLHNQVSPYLLQHKNNPVHWQPWGKEALDQAKHENKPIILSIGYAACHWCHVMEKESFEDENVADLMNAHFINIKVDREERPDVDQIYMEAIHQMGLSGGWPLNVFLMPDQKPFYGGTYFPRPKWIQLLNSIKDAFANHESELQKSADGFQKSLNENYLERYEMDQFSSKEVQFQIIQKVLSSIDPYFGGVNKAPKFPMPTLWSFLEESLHLGIESPRIEHLLDVSLHKMAQGGIYDHVSGGFSRYSVDSEWFCPHFEKMLYDNGQLISVYSKTFARTQNPLYKEIIDTSIQFHLNTLKMSNGLYAASMDADSEGEEGKYYVWTFDELNELIPFQENQAFYEDFSIAKSGNWEHGNNILFKKSPFLTENYKNQMTLLADRRAKRIAPAIDDKQLLAWNAMYLIGLLDASKACNNQAYLDEAENMIGAFEKHFYKNGLWLHQTNYTGEPILAFLDDMSFLTLAYLTHYFVTHKEDSLHKANQLIEAIIENFFQKEKGVFCYANQNTAELIANMPELVDSVIPSSNSVIVECLYYVGSLLNKVEYTLTANQVMENIFSKAMQNPTYFSNWWRIMLKFNWDPQIFVKTNVPFENLKELEKTYPKQIAKSIFITEESTEKEYFLVCRGTHCYAPVYGLSAFENLLVSFT